MCMEIEKHEQIAVDSCMLLNYAFGGVDGWLVLGSRVQVKSVKVLALSVQAICTARNTIRIKHWYYFKHEVLE